MVDWPLADNDSMTIDGQRAPARRPNPYADVQVELTALCFNGLMPVVTSGAAISLLVTSILAVHYHSRWFWQLDALLVLPCAARIVVVFLFPAKDVRHMSTTTANRWETVYGIATLVYVVGAATITMSSMHQPDSVALNLTTLGTFAYANGISSRLSLRPWIAKLSGVIMMGGLALAILGSSQAITRYSVVLLALYAYFYCDAIQTKYDILVEQLRLKRKLHDLADHDPLTGLANRRKFQARLAEVCQQPVSFAVLFMDLDGFKKVNDTHGHAIGDTLLQHVAERLRKTMRTSDLLARLGGDEFAVLQTPQATHASAQALASRLNEIVSESYLIGEETIRIGISIGIQLSSPSDTDPHHLLSKADEALYRVKKAGGGSFYFAESPDAAVIVASSTIHQDPPHGVGKLLVRVGE